jgi:hypothetical protein
MPSTFGVAGDDIGEVRLDRGLHGEVEVGRDTGYGMGNALQRRILPPGLLLRAVLGGVLREGLRPKWPKR